MGSKSKKSWHQKEASARAKQEQKFNQQADQVTGAASAEQVGLAEQQMPMVPLGVMVFILHLLRAEVLQLLVPQVEQGQAGKK